MLECDICESQLRYNIKDINITLSQPIIFPNKLSHGNTVHSYLITKNYKACINKVAWCYKVKKD